jgi:hypothetical protein
MIPLTPAVAADLWDKAARSEVGIAIPNNDQRGVARILYATRTALKIPAHQPIRLCSMADGEVWLVKETVEVLDYANHIG